jgi:hypothetical protein
MTREYALDKFQLLEKHKELFQIAAGMCLAVIGVEKGYDEMEKHQWYAQIADCICQGDTSTVTDDEKEAFIKLHLKLMGHNE